ncbi:MAG: PqqD family protein [Bacilli bacterium]|nr:PqqD family protein [Bacilli bacterium]
MKVKKGFMLREVAQNFVVVPVGKAAIDFNGIITLNDTGAFLWSQLLDDIEFAELKARLKKEYQVDDKTASIDIKNFLAELDQAKLIE